MPENANFTETKKVGLNMQRSVVDRVGALGSFVMPSCRKVIAIMPGLFQLAQLYPTGP